MNLYEIGLLVVGGIDSCNNDIIKILLTLHICLQDQADEL